MKTCMGCKYAMWDRTKTGRLSPSGEGRCQFGYVLPKLPQSMYWSSGEPHPWGGQIERKAELKDHCTYWQREE